MPGAGESRLLKVRDLLAVRFQIPQFQRPYDWGPRQVDEFVADLRESSRKRTPLFLGLVVLHWDLEAHGIIDGQQRLTTIMLALAAAGGAKHVLHSSQGPTVPWIQPRAADVAFAKALLVGEPEGAETLSQQLMASAFERLSVARLSLEALLDCEVIVYVAPFLAGATRLFERINLRGKDVSEFDLVKNRLIESAMRISDVGIRRGIEDFVTARYDRLYKLLDPQPGAAPFDSDKLLKLHWILFSPTPFKSGERVLERLGTWMDRPDDEVAKAIETYLDSLVKVAEAWISVERPFDYPRKGGQLQNALLNFARLGREGEMQPLIVAAILAFGEKAHTLIRFCEINSLRAALAQKNSNFGRSQKWRLARQLHAHQLVDARGRRITTPEEVVHQLFWLNTPWWSRSEANSFDHEMSSEQARSEILPDEALDSPKFLRQYRGLVHYLFWNYGRFLHGSERWGESVKVDISQFQESVWFNNTKSGFRSWDIEHIYPQRPSDRGSKAGREFQAAMADWLDHLGNLTVLPIRDNRGVGNANFQEKLAWMQDQQKVPFNELLANRSYTGNLMDKPRWGPNNCRKRMVQIREFAADLWGEKAIRELGVGDWDDRVDSDESEDIELEEAMTAVQLAALRSVEDCQPTLLQVGVIDHPAWGAYSIDYNLCAPHKLIMVEAIEHVESMITLAKMFQGLDETEEGLQELLQTLRGSDEDSRLDPNDEAVSVAERHDMEASYALSIKESAHSLVDAVQSVRRSLPTESEELEELNEGARKAAAVIGDGLDRTLRLVGMLFEQWSGLR